MEDWREEPEQEEPNFDAEQQHDDQGMRLLAEDLDELNALKLSSKRINEQIEILQASIIKQMKANQQEEIEFYDGAGNPVKATRVQGSTRTWDPEVLRKADPRIFEAVTKVSVVAASWDKADKMGLISNDAMLALTIKPKSPYILFSSPLEEAPNE